MQRQAKKVTKPKKLNDKLRNNTTFGQLIENLMKKFDAKVVNTRKQYLSGHLHQALKEESNFLMEQKLSKAKIAE